MFDHVHNIIKYVHQFVLNDQDFKFKKCVVMVLCGAEQSLWSIVLNIDIVTYILS